MSKPFARDFTAKVVPRRILWPGSKRNIFYSAVKCASFEADQEIDVGFAGIVRSNLQVFPSCAFNSPTNLHRCPPT